MKNLFPMTKDQYAAYLKSAKWKKIRYAVLKRDGFTCSKCGGKFNLQVHHLTYDHIGEELLEDLKTLCRDCHTFQHKGELIIKLIELCCQRFLSQPPSQDYNPVRIPLCHGCDKPFDFEETRWRYGTNAFGDP